MKITLNMTEFNPTLPNEFLHTIIFSKEEVLSSEEGIRQRAEKLLKAVQNGRFFYQKANLTVETAEGMKMVQANIWEATDLNVILMDGITIPVNCIHEVTFEPQLTDDYKSVIKSLPFT